LVLVLLVVSVLSVVVVLSRQRGWILVVFAALAALIFWFFPRMVRLEIDPQNMTVADGPDTKQLQGKLPYPNWEGEEPETASRLGPTITFLAILAGILALFAILQSFL